MPLVSTRRRVVAALAAMGATGLLPASARAAGGTQPCLYSETGGTYANPSNIFEASGTRASFGFLASIKAVGDEITLYAAPEQGGVAREQLALVKGTLTRVTMYDPLVAEQIGFEMPITALTRDGQYYGIVGMAFDQGTRAGVLFHYDGQQVGGYELLKGQFDPTSREISFNGEAAGQIYGWLRGDKPFVMKLTVGEQVFSELTVEPGTFAAFIDGTVTPRMTEVAVDQMAGSCGLTGDGTLYNPTAGCFLTSACCAVVGLADDCWELSALRRFRDGWMRGFAQGRAEVARYYREAPAVADRLMADSAGRARLLRLYWGTIVPSAILVRLGANRLAWRLYRRMMLDLLPA
jgi:hypothetical protein